jgi:hypothetical protein
LALGGIGFLVREVKIGFEVIGGTRKLGFAREASFDGLALFQDALGGFLV